MSIHAFNSVFVHLIWSTIEREKIFFDEIRLQVFEYINLHCHEIGIHVYAINVQPEHIHILLLLPAELSISETAKQLKGNSSKWINDNNLLKTNFSWQRGYGAFAVSASQFETVRNYIYNQDDHHKRMSFDNEYKTWLRKYKKSLSSC